MLFLGEVDMNDFTLVISHDLSSLEGGFDRSDTEAYDFLVPVLVFWESFVIRIKFVVCDIMSNMNIPCRESIGINCGGGCDGFL